MSARYRKISPRFWRDEKVTGLTMVEKCIALYLFTGQSNRIGLFNFSPGEAAEDLGTLLQTFREGFEKVCESLNFGWDERARVLYVPTWWKYNCPENPNVLKACLQDLQEIPQTHLLAAFSSNLQYLPQTFHETFLEGLPKPSMKPSPNQEQEQKQEQKNDGAGAKAPKGCSLKAEKKTSTIPEELQRAVENIIMRLNQLAGTQYTATSKIVQRGLVFRLRDGASESDCLAVLENRWREWSKKADMVQHFNPETLFRESNFEKYLNAARMNGSRKPSDYKNGMFPDL